MKLVKKLALMLMMMFGLVSCDAVIGSDDGDDEETDADVTEQIEVPTDLSAVAILNNDDYTAAGALELLEDDYRLELFFDVNSQRTALGLNSLFIDTRLNSLAEEHNEYMVAQAALDESDNILVSHDNYDTRAGTMFGYLYYTVGENVAAVEGFAADDVVPAFIEAWGNSSGHQVNIEDEDFTHTGINVHVDTATGVIYVTQLFAAF